jgi:hypothetical protein
MVLVSRPVHPLQLVVFVPVIALLGTPVSAHAGAASARVTVAEMPATGEPCDASLWTLEAPVRTISPSRPLPPGVTASVPAFRPPAGVRFLMDAERLAAVDLARSGPRSPRAPPAS